MLAPLHPNLVNSASRVLGNLAQEEDNIGPILASTRGGTLAQGLADQLSKFPDTNCKQSLLRTIQKLSLSHRFKDDLQSPEAMQSLVECVKLENRSVSAAALKTIEVLTGDGEIDFVQPLCSPYHATGTIPCTAVHR